MEQSRIAVAGATGRAGGATVAALQARGWTVVPIARSLGVDVATGDGLDAALAGVQVVVDATSWPSPDEQQASAFFAAAAHQLSTAGRRAGVTRAVVVSILGIDQFSAGYNRVKRVHEREWFAGPLPVRVLRATQFHEFVPLLLQWGQRGDTTSLARMRTQLVAARAVGEALADLAVDPDPHLDGTITEVAGPQEERLVEAAQLLADRWNWPGRLVEVDDPTDRRGVFEAGGLLPGPGVPLRGPTFAAWLEQTCPPPPESAPPSSHPDGAPG